MADKDLRFRVTAKDETGATLVSLRGKLSDLDKTAQQASTGSTALGGALGKVGAIAGGFTVGAALVQLPGMLMAGAKGAAEDAASMDRLQQAVENTGSSFADYSSGIDDAIKKGQELAFTDGEISDALGTLVSLTGSTEEGMSRLGAAMDLARGAGIGLDQASKLLGKTSDENTSALARLGIKLDDTATAMDVLAAVEQKFGGQAGTFAESASGKYQLFQNQLVELQETIGGALLPAFEALVPAIAAAGEAITPLAEGFGTLVELGVAGISEGIRLLVDAFESLPEPVQEVIKVYLSLGPAMIFMQDQFKQTAAGILDAAASIIDALSFVADGFNETIGRIPGVENINLDKVINPLREMADELRASAEASGQAADGISGVGSAAEGAAGEFVKLGDALSEADTADALIELVENAGQLADVRFDEFLDGLTGVKERALDASIAQLELQKASEVDPAVIQSLEDQITALEQQKDAVNLTEDAWRTWYAAVGDMQGQLGGTEGDVIRMRDAIQGVADKTGDANGAIALANDLLFFMGPRADEAAQRLADLATEVGATEVKVDDFGNAVLTVNGQPIVVRLEDLATPGLLSIKSTVDGIPRFLTITAQVQINDALNQLATLTRSASSTRSVGVTRGVESAGRASYGRDPEGVLGIDIDTFVIAAEAVGEAIQNLPQLADEIADGIGNFLDTVGDAVSLIPDLVEAFAVLPDLAMPAQQSIDIFYGVLLNIGYVIERLPGMGEEIAADISNFLGVFGDGISLIPDIVEGLEVLDEIVTPSTTAIHRFAETIRLIGNQMAILPGLGGEIADDISSFISVTGDAVGLIPSLAEGLALIDQVIPPGMLAIYRFAETVRLIGQQVAILPGLGEEIADDISNFISVTGDALGLMDGLVEFLDRLDEITQPAPAQVLRFRNAILMIGNAFADLPGIGANIGEKIEAFLGVAGSAIGMIGDAVEGFARLPDIVVPEAEDLQTFADGIVSMVDVLIAALEEAEINLRGPLMENVAGFADAASSVLGSMGSALDIFTRWEEVLASIRKDEGRFEAVMDEFVDRFVYVVTQAILKIQTRLTPAQAELGAAIGGAASAVFGAISAGIDAMNGILEGSVPQFRDTTTAVMDGLVAAIEVINNYEGVLEQNAAQAQNLVAQVVAILEPLGQLVGGGFGGGGGGGGSSSGSGLNALDLLASALYQGGSRGGTPYLQLILNELQGGLSIAGGGALVSGASGGSSVPIASDEWGGMLTAVLGSVPAEAAGRIARLLEHVANAPELQGVLNSLAPDTGPARGYMYHPGTGEMVPLDSSRPGAGLSWEAPASAHELYLETLRLQPIEITLVMPNGDVIGKAATEGRSNDARRRGYLT